MVRVQKAKPPASKPADTMAKAPASKPADTMAKAPASKPVEPVKKTTFEASASKMAGPAIGLKKECVKTRGFCKVTFRLPRVAAPDAKSVYVVGEFNNWNIYANPMEKQKNGDFALTLELKPGREYQFRYLIDQSRWENDWNADKYVKTPFGDSDNSVIVL